APNPTGWCGSRRALDGAIRTEGWRTTGRSRVHVRSAECPRRTLPGSYRLGGSKSRGRGDSANLAPGAPRCRGQMERRLVRLYTGLARGSDGDIWFDTLDVRRCGGGLPDECPG